MKLRNKKTREIADLSEGGLLKSYYSGNHIIVYPEGTLKYYAYDSLSELNEEWEDVTNIEPLIKDEKIRKAVRAWAEANGYSLVKVGYDMASEPNNGYVQIHFEGSDIVDEDKYGVHTIAELCGEEE